MPFGLSPFWTQALLKQPFPNWLNRNLSFLLFLFLPALAIQGFLFPHFLWGSDLTPLKGFRSWAAWFCFYLPAYVVGMLSDYALGASGCSHLSPTHLHDSTLVSHLSPICLPFAPHCLRVRCGCFGSMILYIRRMWWLWYRHRHGQGI